MEPPSNPRIAIANETGRRIPRSLIARAIAVALAQHGREGEAVSVLIADDDRMRDLNRRFRKLDESTDVLTFPADPTPGFPLGDVAISLPYAERQAQARGVSLRQELGYLAIHGALHLVGLDDETESDQRRMVAAMNRAALAAGLEPDEHWASLLHEEAR